MTATTAAPGARRPPPWWAWIVAAGMFAHGIVPLTDHVLWDGWWYAADLARGDGPSTMSRLFGEVGRPLDMVFYAPLRWLGGDPVAWSKCLGTAAWIGSAIAIAAVLRRIGAVPVAPATAIGSLVATLPVFDLLGELSLWMNTACVLLFWLAWLAVSLLPGLSGSRRIAARIAALALFFVSFDLNSNLVMFYAVAAALALLRIPDVRRGTLLRRLPAAALRHADFLTLPVAFWLWKTWFTPTSGAYASGYNQPSLAADQLAVGYLGMLLHLVIMGLVDMVAKPSRLLAAGAVAAIAATILRRTPRRASGDTAVTGLPWRLLGAGAFLLAAAAFPYIVVGQPLANEGWITRNCILCPLPMAMMACGALMLATRWWLVPYPRAWITGAAALAALGVASCLDNYLAYQALGAKCWSIRGRLAEAIRESGAAVVQLRDYVRIPGTIPYYPPLIWTFIASGTLTAPAALVIETVTLGPDVSRPGPDGEPERVIPSIPLRSETVDRTISETTMPYALERVPRFGPQILVTAEPGYRDRGPADLGLRYLVLRWLVPARRDEFVRGFTTSEIIRLPPLR